MNVRFCGCHLAALMLVSTNSSATPPPRYPEEDWRAVSKIVADRHIPAQWRDTHGHSRVYFQLIYGSEALAVKYIHSEKRKGPWMEGELRLMTQAVAHGSQRVVQALLDAGETPDSIAPNEESPLTFAASYGHLEIMRMLIKANANMVFATTTSVDAFRRALNSGQGYAANLLIDSGLSLAPYKRMPRQGNLVFDAIQGGALDALQLVIGHGFDVNLRNDAGETPLTFAVLNGGSRQAVQFLLANGADECVHNSAGVRPSAIVASISAKPDTRNRSFEGIFTKACSK